ncbi:MAG: ABC transporter ATP-binding protein [Desulfobacterales bacterium]|jgi:ABC-2 type transport system ATP-binding protein
METILEVKNLVKKYDQGVAVDDISFALRKGVCFGLLGPNGAGKTTTIEVIEDVIPPTAGEILYRGKSRSPSFREEVGIQFQSTALLNLLTVRETLETFQSFFSKTTGIGELVELCRLGEFLDQYNDKISGGQRQRFLLALALVNRPELLFLDEPSTGLDPQARRNLWDLIQGIKAKGKTLILTTHYMEEAQYLCDEVAIMDYGKIIAQGPPGELIRRHSRGITVVLPRKRYALKANSFPLPVHEVKDTIEIKTDDVNHCLEQLINHDVDLSDISVRSPNLETVFLNLTGRKLRE